MLLFSYACFSVTPLITYILLTETSMPFITQANPSSSSSGFKKVGEIHNEVPKILDFQCFLFF